MNKKEAIFNAALKLFAEKGEQSTSMKLIAKTAGCGIGTMYNYFPSKDKLINELYFELKTRLNNVVIDGVKTDEPIKKQFIGSWLRLLDYIISNPLEYKFLEIYGNSSKIEESVKEQVDKLCKITLDTFERGKKEGVIKDYETNQLVSFTNSAIIGAVMSKPDIDEKGKKEIVLMAWDAIKS